VSKTALAKLNGLHRKHHYQSALLLLRGLRDYQLKMHMPVPGILRDNNVDDLEDVIIDLTGEDEEPAPSRAGVERVIIDLDDVLTNIHKSSNPKMEPPHV
jgi:hypothetical protein